MIQKHNVGLLCGHEADSSKVSPHLCLLKFKSRQAGLARVFIPVKKELICSLISQNVEMKRI